MCDWVCLFLPNRVFRMIYWMSVTQGARLLIEHENQFRRKEKNRDAEKVQGKSRCLHERANRHEKKSDSHTAKSPCVGSS